jgi:uncharacterized protein VirK/YbjX
VLLLAVLCCVSYRASNVVVRAKQDQRDRSFTGNTVSVQYLISTEPRREVAAPGLFLGPLSNLAKQKKTWTPALLAGVLWRAVSNIGKHRRIMEVLKYPEFADLAQADPRFAFKYLTHGYLARSFSVAQRAASFTHHYQALHDLLPRPFLTRVLHRDITLLQMREADARYAVTFGLSRSHDKEGELSLNFQVDGTTVFIMSFTIVPGHVIQSPSPDVLFITRIQGVKGCYRQISRAIKALHDVAPGALLLAALQGVGQVLGIPALACISGVDQNSYCPEWDASFKIAYDNFFTELGVEKNAAGFFVADIPLNEKPLVLIKQGHKLRTREKREFKRKITDKVCEMLSANYHGKNAPVRLLRMAPLSETILSARKVTV